MTNYDELNEAYFAWMCDLVCDEQYTKNVTYHSLMRHLHEIEFEYILPMDGNRAEDGVDLRYRFAYETHTDQRLVASYLDDRPCSVLEMMIALSVRCEEHIMSDPDMGDRTGQWFWNMIVNLGLGGMIDARYDEQYVDRVIHKFLKREYKRNGEGGLFTVEYRGKDMRTTDIWYQMNYYLSDFV